MSNLEIDFGLLMIALISTSPIIVLGIWRLTQKPEGSPKLGDTN